ncbi:NAD(P)/FAD-dependent oxidoreductase [Thalassospira lohafexi]|uniref:Aminoacetone oxidase family FAD-binding enzyme n=1 Tax=Thalassospira lohafexi TaxID=744227 RepID=A0A2N3L568_9PROT|nr:NAD(P)/FAD-dependent oxidoreductase [Thalassospira lohafexi]PKR57989.1 aminoacetone oxidase family FAD-binding enzyme [Thalassospira lohafexi]
MKNVDVLVIGAGAAGLMCAIEAGKRGRSVVVVDHSDKPAEKIRISGGGRCNFTNIHTSPENFLSQNKRFCVSALKRYTQHDFIEMVNHHEISWHEKTLGQLFCDESSFQIIDMLLDECDAADVTIRLNTEISNIIRRDDGGFDVTTRTGAQWTCASLVVACGGLSIPKIGATGFGYQIARQFGLNIIPTRAALVPLTFDPELRAQMGQLSGISVDAVVQCNKKQFREGLLFTHRGLSGPSILQISSYCDEGDGIVVNLNPEEDAFDLLKSAKSETPKQAVHTVLSRILPNRLAQMITARHDLERPIGETGDKALRKLAMDVNQWAVMPNGTEGYRTAEVTIGGVDTNELSSKTMECRSVPGLYFIGEVVDVTGHLGGFNFQWAWSSGWSAGQVV